MIHIYAPNNTPMLKMFILKRQIDPDYERNYKYKKFFDDGLMFDGGEYVSDEQQAKNIPTAFDATNYWVITNFPDKLFSVSTKNSIKSVPTATVNIKNAREYFNLTRETSHKNDEYMSLLGLTDTYQLGLRYTGKTFVSDPSMSKGAISRDKIGNWDFLDNTVETLFFTNDIVVVRQFSNYLYDQSDWTTLDDCYKTIFVGYVNVVGHSGEGQSFELNLNCEGLAKRLRTDLFVQFQSVADLIAQTGQAKVDFRTSGVASPFSNLTVSQLICELLLSYFYTDTGRKPFNFISANSIASSAQGLKVSSTKPGYIDLYIDKNNTKKFAEIKNIITRAFDYVQLNDFKNYFFNTYAKPIDLINDMVSKYFTFFYQDDEGILHFDDINHTISTISSAEALYKMPNSSIYNFDTTQDDSTLLTRVRITPDYQFTVDTSLIQLETREDTIPDVEKKFGIRDYEVLTVRGVTSPKEIFNFARSFLLRNNSQYESLYFGLYNEPMIQINNNMFMVDFMSIYLVTDITRNIDSDMGSNTMGVTITWARKPLSQTETDKIKSTATVSIDKNIDLNTRTYIFNFYNQYKEIDNSEKYLYGLYWQIIPRLVYSEGIIPTA